MRRLDRGPGRIHAYSGRYFNVSGLGGRGWCKKLALFCLFSVFSVLKTVLRLILLTLTFVNRDSQLPTQLPLESPHRGTLIEDSLAYVVQVRC